MLDGRKCNKRQSTKELKRWSSHDGRCEVSSNRSYWIPTMRMRVASDLPYPAMHTTAIHGMHIASELC